MYHTHNRSPTHTYTNTLIHSFTHTLIHPLIYPRTHTLNSLIHSYTHSVISMLWREQLTCIILQWQLKLSMVCTYVYLVHLLTHSRTSITHLLSLLPHPPRPPSLIHSLILSHSLTGGTEMKIYRDGVLGATFKSAGVMIAPAIDR